MRRQFANCLALFIVYILPRQFAKYLKSQAICKLPENPGNLQTAWVSVSLQTAWTKPVSLQNANRLSFHNACDILTPSQPCSHWSLFTTPSSCLASCVYVTDRVRPCLTFSVFSVYWRQHTLLYYAGALQNQQKHGHIVELQQKVRC